MVRCWRWNQFGEVDCFSSCSRQNTDVDPVAHGKHSLRNPIGKIHENRTCWGVPSNLCGKDKVYIFAPFKCFKRNWFFVHEAHIPYNCTGLYFHGCFLVFFHSSLRPLLLEVWCCLETQSVLKPFLKNGNMVMRPIAVTIRNPPEFSSCIFVLCTSPCLVAIFVAPFSSHLFIGARMWSEEFSDLCQLQNDSFPMLEVRCFPTVPRHFFLEQGC